MQHSFSFEYGNVRIRPLERKDIELLRNWRNSSDTSQFLRKISFITEKMQTEWFEKYLLNSNEIMFTIDETKELKQTVGSFSLLGIENESVEFGRFLIGEKNIQGKHIGTNAIKAAISLVFEVMGKKAVYLHVYESNIIARHVYEICGFVECDRHMNGSESELTLEISKKEWERKMIHNINRVKMLEFPQRGDERGHLVVIEGNQDVPFDIKRAFYIYGSDVKVIRGQHANRESEFVLINVAGKSKVRVMDGEGNEAVFCLNRPHTGIYLPSMVWKEMYDFSEDSVLLVLSNTHYDSKEYIRDYAEFVKEIRDGEE